MRKRLTALLLVLTLLLSVAPISAFAEELATEPVEATAESPFNFKSELPVETLETLYPVEEPLGEIKSGSCGADVYWSLNTSTGVLTIGGSGNMDEYATNETPWHEYNKTINTVNIYPGVTSIGESAFNGCTNLKNVEIPDSVQSIGYYAFAGSPWLKAMGEFAIINGVLIQYQGNKTDVTIPNTVTSIGGWAFDNCHEIGRISIPNSVTSIGDGAFYGCTHLLSFMIPDSVEKIGNIVFGNCYNIQSITLPNTLKSIGYSVCDGCSRLEVIYYAGTEETWRNIDIGSNNEKLLTKNRVYLKETSENPGCNKDGFLNRWYKGSEIVYTGTTIQSQITDAIMLGKSVTIIPKDGETAPIIFSSYDSLGKMVSAYCVTIQDGKYIIETKENVADLTWKVFFLGENTTPKYMAHVLKFN